MKPNAVVEKELSVKYLRDWTLSAFFLVSQTKSMKHLSEIGRCITVAAAFNHTTISMMIITATPAHTHFAKKNTYEVGELKPKILIETLKSESIESKIM